MKLTTRTIGIVATGGLLLAAIAPSAALAAPPIGHRITICHATNSESNPYRQLTVDVASAGYRNSGHQGEHTGPVFSDELKGQGLAWGDIIPAYTYDGVTYAGQNIDGAGLELWLAGCQLPGEAPDAAAEELPSGSIAEEELPSGTPSDQTPSDQTPSDQTPSDALPSADVEPNQGADEPTPTPCFMDCELVIDGPFPTPTPAATPVGEVLGATGTPDMTPPATDTLATGEATPGSAFQIILAAVAALSLLVLIVGRVPAARRS